MRKSTSPQRRTLALLTAAILLTLSACAPSAPATTPTINATAIYTAAAQTFTAQQPRPRVLATATPSQTPAATVGIPNTGATAIGPTATAAVPITGAIPLPTVGNQRVCNGSAYVRDATIPDGTIMSPGQTFVKSWVVLNTGTCRWDPAYRLVFVGGTPMGAASVALGTRVRSGKQVTISVRLTAPLTPGSYTGLWQLQDVRGRFFGEVITVVITVS